VDRDQVIRPDGAPGTHCIVHLLHGISVLAVDDDGTAYLTQDFHYGVGRTTIEVVSGGVEAGEDPLSAAQRELREELGITAGQWLDMGVCDPFTTIVVSPTRLFLARQLTFGPRELEGTEQTCVFSAPFDQIVQMVFDSQITHGPSSVLILKAREVMGG
jgi:ADP-ribose pyrophosphatase